MKHLLYTIVFISLTACAQGDEPVEENKETTAEQPTATQPCNFCTVAPAEFNNRMKSAPGQILDVRTPEEVANGKISGSVNYNFNAENFETEMQKLDKKQTVYVYCAGGGRSAKAMEWMKTNGFTSVVNLDGGINAWIQNNLPTE